MSLFENLSSRLRNLFSTSELIKRIGDGKIQVKTAAGRILEKKEAHSYGFKAKAKKGTVFVFCQGGNFDSFELLPVVDYDGGPELNDNDVALYTASGGFIVCRENGEVELNGKVIAKAGSFECKGTARPTGQGCLCAIRFCTRNGAPHTGTLAENT
jgi:phage gp45-like